MTTTDISNRRARVAIYVRVSTLHQVDRDSLPMQKKDLIAYASLILGTDDYVIFEDAGYSGKNTDRPKFQEMMSKIRAGGFTHLLVWKIDRISRNLLDFATMYNELKELGVIFVSKNEQFDTSTAMGEAMLKIILVFAELERNMTSERVTATMISRASNGQWNGGRVPYGYTWNPEDQTFSFNSDEYNIAHMIHDLYEEMRSLVRLARYLNDSGYRTRAGNEWNPVSLLVILRSVFYCGDYQYNRLKEGSRQKVKDESEWVTIRDHHPAIVSREQKERIISILEVNSKLCHSRNLYKSPKHIHVFASLCYCGSCGKPMGSALASPKKDWRYSTYSCATRRKSSTACTGKSISDPILGEFVFNFILNMMNAQHNFGDIASPADLERLLLLGDTFKDIEHVDPSGLNDLFSVLSSGEASGDIYGKSVLPKRSVHADSDVSRLRQEKVKAERALDRLRNLYLYSDDAISEREFMVEKTKLTERIDEISEQIGILTSGDWQQSLSDEDFLLRASEFIISRKLSGRKYVSYKRLAMSVDVEVLRNFVIGIIDSIVITGGRVQTITFRNGLSHTFIYGEKPGN